MRVITAGRDRFRARLLESIERTGLSQGEVARRIGVKRAAVNSWCKGRNTPPLETTRKLGALFRWQTAEILGWFGVYEPSAGETQSQIDIGTETAKLPASVTVPVTVPEGHSPSQATAPGLELVPVPTPDHSA